LSPEQYSKQSSHNRLSSETGSFQVTRFSSANGVEMRWWTVVKTFLLKLNQGTPIPKLAGRQSWVSLLYILSENSKMKLVYSSPSETSSYTAQ